MKHRDNGAMRIGFFAIPLLLAVSAAAQTTVSPQPSAAPTEISPELKELSKLGDSQMDEKNYDAAIATYHRLIDQLASPRDKADVWSRIAEARRRGGNLPESMQALQQAAALAPDSASLHLNIGLLYEAQGDKAHARQSYEKAVALEPNNPLVLNNLAFLLSENAGDLDRALNYATTARRAMPKSMAIVDTIGWIYLKKNLIAIAVEQFRTAATNSPDEPEFHYHYAIALNRMGDKIEAAKECQAALSKSPSKELDASIRRECAPR